MESVSHVQRVPLPADSPYVRPFRLLYTQAGRRKTWDLLEVHDSVAAVIFNVTRRVVVLVKQFRPAVYYNSVRAEERAGERIDVSKYPGALGVTLEVCAGIVDKDKALVEIAREEVLEECGYNVPLTNMQHVCSYRSGVGVQGAMQTLFYCEVTDDMRVDAGGGVDDELIDVVELSIPQVEEMLDSPGPLSSPPSALYALTWFLRHKADVFRK